MQCSASTRYEYQTRLVKGYFTDGENGIEVAHLDCPESWVASIANWVDSLLLGTQALLNKAAPAYSNIIQAVISDSLRIVYVSSIKNTLRLQLFSKCPKIRLLKLSPFGGHDQHI